MATRGAGANKTALKEPRFRRHAVAVVVGWRCCSATQSVEVDVRGPLVFGPTARSSCGCGRMRSLGSTHERSISPQRLRSQIRATAPPVRRYRVVRGNCYQARGHAGRFNPGRRGETAHQGHGRPTTQQLGSREHRSRRHADARTPPPQCSTLPPPSPGRQWRERPARAAALRAGRPSCRWCS